MKRTFLFALSALISLAVLILLPVAVPVALLAVVAVPGFALFHRTSDRFAFNLASFHSPREATWSWCLSLIRPRSADEGRWFSCYAYGDDCTWRAALQIARHQIVLARQFYHLKARHDAAMLC